MHSDGRVIYNEHNCVRIPLMNLQSKLVELAEYGIGFNMHTGHVLVNITYKPGWTVIKPTDETITFMSDEQNENLYYYSAPMTTDIASIFTTIDETIAYNKELEEKVILFKERVGELQELFASTPIELLKKLVFTIPEEQAPKKKTSRKKQEKTKGAKHGRPQKKEKAVKKEPKPKELPTEVETETVENEAAVNLDEVIINAMKEKEGIENALP